MKPLTPKQARFAEEYLVDLNATKAAQRAGFSGKTAYSAGQRLLKNVEVAKRIAELMAKRSERVEVKADEVLRELLIILRSDVRQFNVNELGQLTLEEGAPDNAWRAVSSVKHRITTREGTDGESFTTREIEFRLWNKNDAIAQSMKHLGLYAADKHEVTGKDGTPLIPVEVLQRALLRVTAAGLGAPPSRLAVLAGHGNGKHGNGKR
ncbi:MAG: terminase small subunit [Gemmatimonadaceae bacterium]